MRLFGYIAIFVDDVRDYERTIWHHARWGRGGKRMRIREEEVSLSQPITTTVPPEEEEVPVPWGPAVVIPPGEEVPLNGRGGPSPPPLSWFHCMALQSWSHQRKKSHRFPLSLSRRRKRRSQPLCHSPTRRKGMPCLGTALGKFFALLFFSKTQEILLILFSHKHNRCVG
jgi:hypothetical protein